MSVPRATHRFLSGNWPADEARGTVTLAYGDRYRRRIMLTLDGGAGEVLLDLQRATRLRNGDGLLLEDGGWIGVRAAEEDVLDIRAEDTTEAIRIAWHLGNRHLPVQILQRGGLRILYDHVIEAMVRDMGGRTLRRRDIFIAERGAYEDDHEHGGTED